MRTGAFADGLLLCPVQPACLEWRAELECITKKARMILRILGFYKIVHRWRQFLLFSCDPSFFLAKVCSYVSCHIFIYNKIESIYIISICWTSETDLKGGHNG